MNTRLHSHERDQDFSDVERATLLHALAGVLPGSALLAESEDLKPYECDGLSAYRRLPLAVALPENED